MHAPQIVDLFAGPGGLDVAAQRLGVPVTGVEWDKDACATRDAVKLVTEPGDVRGFGPGCFPEATVLAGGPPCQTFTVAGSGAGRRALDDVLRFIKRMAAGDDISEDLKGLDDERTGLVLEPLRWALEAISAENLQAYDVIVLEQVPAVLPVWEAVGEALEGHGYSVDCGVLRTEQFGVPQTRRRAVLIARRNGRAVLPEPTHRPYRKGVGREEGDPRLQPWVPMGEVVKRPTSYDVVSNYGTGGDPKERGRRSSDMPSFTVTGKISRNRVISHNDAVMATGAWSDRFTPAEAGQLQTFPADYKWSGYAVAQQIGNAIPPRLGIHVLAAALGLGEEVRNHALDRLDKETGAPAEIRPKGPVQKTLIGSAV